MFRHVFALRRQGSRCNRVLPPGVSTGASEASLRFDYVYDAADRMTSKKVPDAAAVTMKYNNRDQLVLSQDGNLLAAGKWMLVKYDDYGRPISSGLHTGANPDPNNTGLAYNEQHTATTYGTSGVELGKIKTAQSWMPGGASITRTYTYSTITGRMLTDNGANHLNGNTGSDNYTYAYDYAGNLLSETRAHKTSSASATLILLTRRAYDHSGRNTALYHKINTNAEKQLAKYVYDFRDRLIDKSLDSVRVGSVSSWLQSIDYAYNEQNWLTSINSGSSFGALSQDAIALCSTNPGTPNPAETAYATNPDGNDLFKVDLYYDSPGLTFGSPAPNGQRNGNISQLVWQTRGRQRQGYTLQYDYLDRLTTAYYADINSTGTATTDNKYQENISYADARGNIQSINRRGMYKDPFGATCFTNGVIDNLTYTYNYASNRIQKIADATANSAAKAQGFNPGSAGGTSTYSYDANGNLTSDPYKGISGMTVTYNHLNLPASMSFGSNGSLAILYDHAGKKLRKTVSPTTSTGYTQDYVSGLEYRTNGGGGTLTLEAIYHAEGRITPLSGSNYQYEYTIKDHLGNARLSFADLNANSIVDVPGDILQENHYYPFGMNMNYGWMNAAALDNRYQYNGKELNDDFGLNWNDYGARWYEAAVGRFPSVDPIIDKFPYLTPYNYASNSPVAKIDLYGLQGVPTTADGVWQYMWSSTGLTNDWGGIDKVKQLAKDVVIEAGKIIATMAIIEIATPVIIEALGVEGGEAIALTTSAIRAERSVANTIVPAANSEVRQAALNRAVVEVETSAKPPTMTAAVRDAETGKIYTDVSGKPHPILSKDLQKQAPNPSKEPWPPCNCAETKAANQAVKDGAKLKNLEHHTVRTKTGQMAPPCRNCRETLKQSTHVKN
jgi:RHS repeat-associated protein